MAPSVRGSSSASGRTSTSLTIPKPTGTVDGDLLLAYTFCTNSTLTPPAGWTVLTTMSGSYGGVTQFGTWLTKVAASEGTSYVFTTGNVVTSGMIIALQGAAVPEAITNVDFQHVVTPFTHVDWSSVTSLGTNRLLLLTAGYNNPDTITVWPTGFTDRGADAPGGAGNTRCFMGSKDTLVGAGATGTLSGTCAPTGGGKWQLGALVIPSGVVAAVGAGRSVDIRRKVLPRKGTTSLAQGVSSSGVPDANTTSGSPGGALGTGDNADRYAPGIEAV